MLGPAVRAARACLVPTMAHKSRVTSAVHYAGGAAWSHFAAAGSVAFARRLDALSPLAGLSGARSVSHWAALLAVRERERSRNGQSRALQAPSWSLHSSTSAQNCVPRALLGGAARRAMSSMEDQDERQVYKSVGHSQLSVRPQTANGLSESCCQHGTHFTTPAPNPASRPGCQARLRTPRPPPAPRRILQRVADRGTRHGRCCPPSQPDSCWCARARPPWWRSTQRRRRPHCSRAGARRAAASSAPRSSVSACRSCSGSRASCPSTSSRSPSLDATPASCWSTCSPSLAVSCATPSRSTRSTRSGSRPLPSLPAVPRFVAGHATRHRAAAAPGAAPPGRTTRGVSRTPCQQNCRQKLTSPPPPSPSRQRCLRVARPRRREQGPRADRAHLCRRGREQHFHSGHAVPCPPLPPTTDPQRIRYGSRSVGRAPSATLPWPACLRAGRLPAPAPTLTPAGVLVAQRRVPRQGSRAGDPERARERQVACRCGCGRQPHRRATPGRDGSCFIHAVGHSRDSIVLNPSRSPKRASSRSRSCSTQPRAQYPRGGALAPS